MLKHKNSQSTETCTNCSKNCSLIKKYQELIRLYKKKELKLSIDGSSRISNVRTTNNTIDTPSSQGPCIRLAEVLAQMMKTRCTPFFRFTLPKSAKKFIILNICNRFSKFAKMKAFTKLKHLKKTKSFEMIQLLSQKINKIMKNSFMIIKKYSGISVIQQIINQTLASPEELNKKIIQEISSLSQVAQQPNNGFKLLQKKNIELQIINKKLILQNQTLRQCLEQSAKRQAKENQKKKESLQMLAEQINEKNEQIQHLKQTLKAYEETYQPNGNVLQDDIVSMKKDLDHLQNIRERLNNDLDKIKSQLEEANKNIKAMTQKNQALQKENLQMKKINFGINIKSAKADLISTQFTKFIKSFEKKMKRLNIYQRELEEALQKNNMMKKNQGHTVNQQIKSEIILMFLTNISISDYKLHAEHLFDEDEKTLLKQHKQKWLKVCKEGIAVSKRENAPNLIDNLEISEINMRGGNYMDSIFNALDSPRENRGREGPTMRLLELELEKNKQVNKISELKQKLLHIRVIILKLLKSLELQAGAKPQTDGILRVLFDLFEYSEEERESIFIKKRKLFGLI